MANAIAVSKREIGGMREFSRFEAFHYIAAPRVPSLGLRSAFKCKEILNHTHRSRYCRFHLALGPGYRR